MNIAEKLRGLNKEQKEANLKSLNYIKMLAANTKKDISNWDLLQIFGSEDKVNLLTDKKAINTLFFVHAEPAKDPITNEVVEGAVARPANEEIDFSKVSGVVREAYKKVKEGQTKQLKENIRYWENDIKSLERQISEYTKNILKEQQKLDLFSDDEKNPKEDKLVTDLKSTMNQKLWNNPVLNGDYLFFTTANDIMIQDLTTKKQVNMGQYAVRIDLKNGFNLQVIPYKNNWFVPKGYMSVPNQYHPHIMEDARICWGTASEMSRKHLQNAELDKVLVLLYALLTNYNERGGYLPPRTFEETGRKNIELGGLFLHPDFKK